MTVSTTSVSVPYVIVGAATPLPVPFRVLDAADLVVTEIGVDGVETPQALTADYGVTLSPSGATVTPVSATIGSTWRIERDTALTQPDSLRNQGAYYPESVENMIDRLTLQVQDTGGRALRMPAASIGSTSLDLPAPQPLALLGWNADGSEVQNFPPDNFLSAITAGATYTFPVAAGAVSVDISTVPATFAVAAMFYNGIYQEPSGYAAAGGILIPSEAFPADGSITLQVVLTTPTQITDAQNLNFVPSGAGAATRTVRSKLGDVVSVFDFIPVAQQAAITARTTVYNATASIQAAIDAVRAAGGGVLNFPPGLYLVTSLLFYSGVSLRGAGQGITTLRAMAGRNLSSAMLINGDIDNASSARTCTAVTIEGITFDGNNLAYPKWLQNPTTLAAIADPQNDYFANGGKIGNAAYAADRDGICLAQTPASGATLNKNGVLGGVLTPAVRRVTIFAAASNTGRNFTITGTDYNNAPLVEVIAGPGAGLTVTTAGVFKTITTIVVDASAPAGNVEVGTTDFDIFGAVAEGRRNPAFTAGYMLGFIKTIDCLVQRCSFINHSSPGISEGGSLNLRIRQCHFENIGRDDGPHAALWVQSYGTPTAPPVYYQDSENIIVEDCTAKNLNRLFAIFAPTKGGVIRNCRVDGYKEAAVFANTDFLNINGGRTRIEGCVFLNGVVSDIVSHAIEYTGAKRVDIINNHFENNNHNGISAEGMQDCTIEGNTFKNIGGGFTYPYGPFSERYSFGSGSAPVAGTVVALANTNYVTIGSIGATGNNGLRIARNKFIETRGTYPPLFKQTKSGTNFLAKNVYIEGNLLDVPAAMVFLDKTVTSVWEVEMSLFIRNNVGHVSEGSVLKTVTMTSAAGAIAYPVNCGFRPSRIEVIAARTGLANENRRSNGFAVWQRLAVASVPNSASNFPENNAAAARAIGVVDGKIIRLIDSALATTTDVVLTSWEEDGFTMTVTAIADTTIAVRLLCHP